MWCCTNRFIKKLLTPSVTIFLLLRKMHGLIEMAYSLFKIDFMEDHKNTKVRSKSFYMVLHMIHIRTSFLNVDVCDPFLF